MQYTSRYISEQYLIATIFVGETSAVGATWTRCCSDAERAGADWHAVQKNLHVSSWECQVRAVNINYVIYIPI